MWRWKYRDDFRCRALSMSVLVALTVTLRAAPFGPGFVYNGRLADAGGPAQGQFAMVFELWNAETNGMSLGSDTKNNVAVSNGLFTVELTFAPALFNGDERWLEISLRPPGGGDAVTLAPRQRIAATPYALRARTAETALLALTVPDGAITSSKLATGAVTSVQIAPNSITAGQLAPGSALANLNAGGAGFVPNGGILLSEHEVNPVFLNAGFSPLPVPALAGTGESWTNLPPGPPATGNLLPERYGHKAVWTGTEMLIIGGTPDNLGLRYHLGANSWSVMTQSNMPAIGDDVEVAWTGTLLLVWDAAHRIGGRYNPSTDTWTAMSEVGAPIARVGAASAFAGGYLVVWGGRDPDTEFGVLNTGGRYNPANDTWTTMTLVNAPRRRIAATMTAIGSEILMFGGAGTNITEHCPDIPCENPSYETDYVALPSGARYNPAANSWTAISDAPSGRYYHTATWSGSELIVWGGPGLAPRGLKYNLGTDSWSLISTNGQPEAKASHSAVWSGNSVIVWGGGIPVQVCFIGCTYIYFPTNAGYRYFPATDSWAPISSSSASSRMSHSAVWTGTQMILFGGIDSSALADGHRYTLSGNSWTALPTPPGTGEPSARTEATGVWTGDSLIVWGGRNGAVALRTGGILRPGIGWTNTPSGGPSARSGHTAVWTGTEMIIWGGQATFSSVPVGNGMRFNPASNRWFSISSSNAPRARTQHSAVWTGTEMIVWGGFDFTNAFYPTFLNSGARYDPTTDTWKTITNNVPIPSRAGQTAVWTGTEMIIWGGYSHSGGIFATFNYFSSGYRYNPVTGLWSSLPASGLAGRRFHTAVWSGEEMIVWGGQVAAGTTNNGARYHRANNTWTAIQTNNAPSVRYNHTAVWADKPAQMIVWGGDNGTSRLNDGKLYDPYANKWTSITNTSGAPAHRANHLAVWTGSEMIVFNGENAGFYHGDGKAFTPRRAYYYYQKQ